MKEFFLTGFLVLFLGLFFFSGCIFPTGEAKSQADELKAVCGNDALDLGENCNNCPTDAPCLGKKICCTETSIPSCVFVECTTDSDCDDESNLTADSCVDVGKGLCGSSAHCENYPINS